VREPELTRQLVASPQPPLGQSPAPAPVGVGGASGSPAVQPVQYGAAREMLDAGRGAVYVVRPGDTLWEIAEALLGSGASEAEIVREISRLWERNRDRIASGSPDLIRPGERLLLR
jgi:nucleoid-associated protein YgaU